MSRKLRPAEPSPDSSETLIRLLEDLDLTTLAKQLPELLSQAEREAPSYSSFLALLLHTEQAARQDRRVQRLLKCSGIKPGPEDFANYDFSIRPQLHPQAMRELLTCRFLEERRNLILAGKSSTGKSTIARIIGRVACRRGFAVRYFPLSDLMDRLHAARADGTWLRTFRRLVPLDLLIVDDAGFEKLSPDQVNDLFRLVEARSRQYSTIVITNLPFKKWGEFIPSPAQAVAIADRLINNATIIRFNGPGLCPPKDTMGAPLDEEDK